jgi:hypothetical protein
MARACRENGPLKMNLKVLLTILTFLAWGCGTGAIRQNPGERAAASLSKEFETVLYSKPAFVSSWVANNPLPKDSASILRSPFAYLWLGLDSVPAPAASDLLANADAILVGAKDFRAPNGLGPVRSTRCYVATLKSGNKFDLQKHVQASALRDPSGLLIWQWSAKLGEFGEGIPPKYESLNQPSTLYAAELEQSYVIVSNDMNELESLAGSLSGPRGELTKPGSFTDWHEILKHEMAGYRKYRTDALNDPMSAGTQDIPPSAESLTFFLDVEKETITIQLASKSAITEDATAKLSKNYGLPALTQSGPRSWQSSIQLEGDGASFDQTFSLVGLFGFAIFT